VEDMVVLFRGAMQMKDPGGTTGKDKVATTLIDKASKKDKIKSSEIDWEHCRTHRRKRKEKEKGKRNMATQVLGNLYTSDDAVRRAKEVQAKRESAFFSLIDKDVQTMVSKVNDQIDNEIPINGIYFFTISEKDVTYRPVTDVLARFIEKMNIHYHVTYDKYKDRSFSFKPKEKKWYIEFRPLTKEERQRGNPL
jgi:hypothetical protein